MVQQKKKMTCGDFLLFLSVIALTACSDPPLRYRAVSGEVFMMPCEKWFRVGSHRHSAAKEDFAPFKAETAHSGNYTCYKREVRWDFLLQVVNKTMECSSPGENRETLKIGKNERTITCPGHNCSSGTPTVWYKRNKSVNDMKKRGISVIEGRLKLHEVNRHDNAVFFCDRVLSEQGVNWTMRRSVTVKALSSLVKAHPRILSPRNNTVEEVELGTDHTLRCEARFPQADPPGDVRWFMKSSGHLVNLTMEKLEVHELEYEIQAIGKATLKKVTDQDLNRKYTCIAQNTFGNKRATILLKKKNIVHWSSLVEYALGPLLLVTCLTIVLRVKWLEIQIILKSRWTFGKTDVGHKDFDVLLSYVWRTSSTEPISPPVRHSKEDSAFPFKLDPLVVEIPSKRPELLLPHVLEDQWGYRLCLMERDYLPGGAYTEEVADAIQRSQMLICLLSPEYLSDNNAVFVLESAVQALLLNSGIKLQLIWTNTAPCPLRHLDPPLPVVVQKALKVLPALKWTSAANAKFWRNLRKAMPHQRVSSLPKSF